jgi:hypothetical protein
MMLGKVAFARGALELSPEATTGMPIGAQVAQPEPAAIGTVWVRTEVLGGIDVAAAPPRGHDAGWRD